MSKNKYCSKCFINDQNDKVKYFKLSSKEMKFLIMKEDLELDDFFSSKHRKLYLFKENDSVLFSQSAQIGYLFQSVKHFKAFLKYSSLFFNPFGFNLINQIEDIILRLSEKFNIPLSLLEKSISSLELLDRRILDSKVDDEFYLDNLVLFAIYLGEVFLNNSEGEWDMERDSNNNRWIPVIKKKTGRHIYISHLLEEAIEVEYNFGGLLRMVYSRIKNY